jgi:enoyl-CoA hydratase/carnithine racemase
MSEHVRVAVAEGVCTVTLARPEKKNALTRPMYAALAEAFERAAAEEDIRVVLLAAEGDAYCAGNDINDFRDRGDAPSDNPASRRFYFGLAECAKPVIAAVPGLAIGIGCTMLMHCDLVFAAPEARFRLPFVDLGVVPELGSSLLLPRLAGRHIAAELMLLGEFFDAATAREIGLVNRVVERAELLPGALGTARALAGKPQAALRETKRLLRQDMPALLARMEEERAIFTRMLASPETQAIMAGVLRKA